MEERKKRKNVSEGERAEKTRPPERLKGLCDDESRAQWPCARAPWGKARGVWR